MKDLEKRIKCTLIDFQREEIKKRYSIENISALGYSVSEEDLGEMKEFILETFYPDAESREKNEEYFNSLRSLADSRTLAKTIMIAGPIILMNKIGLKKVFAVGIDIASVYNINKSIDTAMIMHIAYDFREAEDFRLTPEVYASAYSRIDPKNREKAIKNTIKLIYHAKEREFIKKSEKVLDNLVSGLSLLSKFHEQAEAVKYVQSSIKETIGFLSKKSDSDLDLYAKIIEGVEKKYNEDFYPAKKEYKAQSP